MGSKSKARPTWEIPTRSRVCSKGQEILQPESGYFTLLTQDVSGAYERRDYCSTCWQSELEAGNIPKASTHWKAVVPARAGKPNNAKERGERALLLLREALASDQQGSAAEAFVLGLYLQRLRLAAARQEIQREGVEYILYEILETGEIITIPKVPLSSLQVVDLQKRLNEEESEVRSQKSEGDPSG